MKLNFKIQGEGYPILCLHGHPGSSESMSVFTNYLSQKYQTIAPDLRGYGNSNYSGNFQMEDHLRDLQELLDKKQIEHCLLLGWSLGGILSLELLLANPQRFSGLILIASAAKPFSSHPQVTPQDLLFTGISGIINYFKPGWDWNINTFGKRSLFRYLIQQQTPSAYKYLATEGITAYFKTSRSANKALSQKLSQGYDRLENLENINVPCLVLSAKDDRHITAYSSEQTAKKIKECRSICYPDTAHLFPWEIPDRVTEDIQQWINDFPQVVQHSTIENEQ